MAGKAALHQGGGTSPVSFDVKKTMEYTSLAWNRDASAKEKLSDLTKALAIISGYSKMVKKGRPLCREHVKCRRFCLLLGIIAGKGQKANQMGKKRRYIHRLPCNIIIPWKCMDRCKRPVDADALPQ